MKIKSMIRSLTVTLVLLFSSVAFSNNASAQVKSYTVGVDGMACPFCTYGIEKKMKKLDGVTGVTIDLKTGNVDVELGATSKVNPDHLAKAVKDAGFEVRGIEVLATGEILIGENQTVLKIGDAKITVKNYQGKSGKFSVVGTLSKDKQGLWSIQVSKASPIT